MYSLTGTAKAAVTVMLSLLLAACKPEQHTCINPDTANADYTDDAIEWADSVLATMTEAQMVGQLLMPAIYSTADSASIMRLRQYADSLHIGGIMLLKGDTTSAIAIAKELTTYCPIHPFIAIDAEWGLGMRLYDAPSYPAFPTLGKTLDERAMYDYGYAVGLQSRSLGINVIFGPVMDVASSHNSVMRKRSLGSNPALVADLGTAYARGLEDASMISVAKHFPGLGATIVDSHDALPHYYASREKLDSIDLLPFRQYVNSGLSGIMVGHIATTAIDSTIRSAAVSPAVIEKLLRSDMQFNGLVFTDAMNMKGLGNVNRPAVQAILAGADILVAPVDTRLTANQILDAIHTNELPYSVIKDRVWRILFYKYSLLKRSPAIP